MNTVVEFHELVLQNNNPEESDSGQEEEEDLGDACEYDPKIFHTKHRQFLKQRSLPPEITWCETDSSFDSSRSYSVCFHETVEVREYSVTLGDHPMSAFPLSLDWNYDTRTCTMAELKNGRQKAPTRLSPQERRAKLKSFGVSDQELELHSFDDGVVEERPIKTKVCDFLEGVASKFLRTLNELALEDDEGEDKNDRDYGNLNDLDGAFEVVDHFPHDEGFY